MVVVVVALMVRKQGWVSNIFNELLLAVQASTNLPLSRVASGHPPWRWRTVRWSHSFLALGTNHPYNQHTQRNGQGNSNQNYRKVTLPRAEGRNDSKTVYIQRLSFLLDGEDVATCTTTSSLNFNSRLFKRNDVYRGLCLSHSWQLRIFHFPSSVSGKY